jgi:molybdopterin adenylyltransferase
MTRVLFFARARELAGTREAELDGTTVAEVIDVASARYGEEFAQLARTCTVVVDGDVVLRSEFPSHGVGAELAILPPVSGGAHEIEDGPEQLRVAVLTVSDRASAGAYDDQTGPAVEALAIELLRATIVARQLVPDEEESIAAAIRWWCDEDVADVVLTNGGTGLGPRDVTPEATRLVLHAEAPGFGELMRAAGLAHTPLAALSRQAAGRRGRTIVVNLPGSVKGATESLGAVAGILGHAARMARS